MVVAAQRNNAAANAFFHGSNQALDEGNAGVFAEDEENVSGTNGTVVIGCARRLSLDGRGIFCKNSSRQADLSVSGHPW